MWSAPAPSAPSTIGPIRPGSSVAPSSAAPAPSANTAAVARSVGSVIRDMKSAPIDEHVARAARLDLRAADRHRREEPGAGGADVERARRASRRAHGRRAAPRSGAPRRRSSSRRARGRRRRPRRRRRPVRAARRGVACVARRSCGSATRRSRIPVRRSIQPSATPSRSAIDAFETTCLGRLVPTDAIAAPTLPRASVRRAGSASAEVVRTVVVIADTLGHCTARRQRGPSETRQPGGRGVPGASVPTRPRRAPGRDTGARSPTPIPPPARARAGPGARRP